MAKSAISADVKAANSKLAQFLRRKEEDEAILAIGKRKPKQMKEERRMPGGRARWVPEPDFKVPTCMVDRPRTVTGATSFHFSYISISKLAVPTLDGKPIQGAAGKLREIALEHSKYIEREGAAERTAGAQHAAYIERPDVLESIDPSALIEEAVERNLSPVFNETPTEEEANLLGLPALAPDGIPSVFSNISSDPFERQEYWRAVERSERNPKVHEIILDPETSPRWWANLADNNTLDPAFKNHALTVAEKYRQHLASPANENGKRPPFKADPWQVSAERAGKLINQSMMVAGYDHSLPPLEFKSGRGGRLQIRFVAELPHELSAEDRALIVQNFCDRLGSLEERKEIDGSVRKVGMMFTAVIHAPDAHNDNRNYHLHIVAHDRPATYLPEHEAWDFEVKEYYTSSRKERVRYPFRQNKIGEIARAGNGAVYEQAGQNFVPAMRKQFADITNKVLAARGVDRRYDHRKYTEMGIDRTPTEHLGTKAAALEAIGVPTTVGQLNAIAIWDDAERSIERLAKQSDKALSTAQRKIVAIAEQVTAGDPGHLYLPALRQLIAERSGLIESLAEDRRAIMAFDHLEAKAKSRAIRTRQTCLQFLADIENGKADATTRVMKFAIQARWRDAQAHINKIDESLQPHREALASAAQEIERREKRVLEIDRLLQPIQITLERRIAEIARTAPIVTAPAPASSETKIAVEIPPDFDEPELDRSNEARPSDAESLSDDAAYSSSGGDENDEKDPSVEPVNELPIQPVELKPVSIEGLPIIKPTIAPYPEQPSLEAIETEVSESEVLSTPDGLEPLRPAVPEIVNSAEPETVIADISLEAPAAAQETDPSPEGQSASLDDDRLSQATDGASEQDRVLNDNQSPLTALPTEPEPKVDRRRAVSDPSLFDLPEQAPPIKPGTTKAEQSDWESLMKRIANDRIPIMVEPVSGGTSRYYVPALGQNDQKLLNAKRFAHRTNNRLAAMHDRQQHEVKRLVRWIADQGQDPTKLILEDRTAKLGDVRDAVRTLMRNWGRNPSVLAAVRAEHDRRIEMANRPIDIDGPGADFQDALGALTREERLAEALAVYPEPDQVYTPEVARFTKLLRELAPRSDLQAAADAIYASIDAREDVNRHTVQLATAYSRYVEGADLRATYRGRDGKGGRG